ncbi:bifunctional ADP-dependent NAD(P)H-hydrate dehydratase/NAD(P)H-hydrate epimerase [Schaalia georgiae]|nr:bifunctional ADP-dependent NAD(P)H-hydrate dehydratase/NAD(P)H-hydrate epimerase [Schaalia georgiae]
MEGMSAAEPTPAHTFATVRRLEAPLIAAARAQGHPDALMERAAMGVADAARGLLERPRGGLRPSAVDPRRPDLDPRGHAPDSGAEPAALPHDIPAPSAVLSSIASHGPSQSPSPHSAAHDSAPEGAAPQVVALVGSGDNGGDALYACAILQDAGTACMAILLKPGAHERALGRARAAGVAVIDLGDRPLSRLDEREAARLAGARVWIDGIVGTGVRGPLEGSLADAVKTLAALKRSAAPAVVAVDVPSGLTDSCGEVSGPLLPAEVTVTMGAHKEALVLPPAAGCAGRIERVELGFVPADAEQSPPVALHTAASAAAHYHAPAFEDHKYTRGVVGVVAGSDTYPGAGVLAVRGALASGVGMVRLNSTRRVEDLVLAAEPGVVTAGGRIQAGLIGPGLDEARRAEALELAEFCLDARLPLVIDAWALDLVPGLAGRTRNAALTITPHYGEAARLLTALGRPTTRARVVEAPLRAAQSLHESTGATVVLKGAATIVYGAARAALVDGSAPGRAGALGREQGDGPGAPCSPEEPRGWDSARAIVSPLGCGWASVAGSGDVLAGLVAGTHAGARARRERDGANAHDPVAEAAAAVWVHGEAARLASRARHAPGQPIQARQIADAIPPVIGGILGA